MGLLEERIVASLNRLRDADPEIARSMLVFPVELMNGVADEFQRTHENAQDGDVILFSRPPEEEGLQPPSATLEELQKAGQFLRAYTRALVEETHRTVEAAKKARAEAEERRAHTGFEPFPLRTTHLTAEMVIEQAQRMRDEARTLRSESEERRAASADDPLNHPPS